MNDKTTEHPQNIVKETAKELGMTQKELAAYMGVGENTISQWARGIIETPQWAIKMFDLLKTERKFNTIKRIISETEL